MMGGGIGPPMPTCMVAPIGTDTVPYGIIGAADTPALYAIGAADTEAWIGYLAVLYGIGACIGTDTVLYCMVLLGARPHRGEARMPRTRSCVRRAETIPGENVCPPRTHAWA